MDTGERGRGEDRALEAMVFDMDGVLVASEAYWREAQREIAASVGLSLTDADLEATQGLPIDACTAQWFARSPWVGPSSSDLAGQVVDRVAELLEDAVPMEGVQQALVVAEAAGLRLALCSSSPRVLIDRVVRVLGLEGRFEVVHSGEDETHGKPDPACYRTTAARLGIAPDRCVAVEDSLPGAIAAWAAGMRVVVVPEKRWDVRFGFADRVLASLSDLVPEVLDDLQAGRRAPTSARPRFHVAFPVDDLAAARAFYGGVLGCPEGRSSERWVDFDLAGHQIVAHLVDDSDPVATNAVDGEDVPARHMGLVVSMEDWHRWVHRLRASDVPFLVEPGIRFAGRSGEQATLFVRDPAGNALEFKAFRDDAQVFRPDARPSTVESHDSAAG
jgi:hypothetical protein